MFKNFVNGISAILNGSIAIIVLVVGFQIYPAPIVQADTTGILPDYKEIKPGDYLFNATLPYDATSDDIKCLVENMYHEARSDGYAGMYAVAMVTLNRVADPRYPDKVCEVVYQGPVRESWKTRQHADLPDSERIYYPRKHRCQFSWYCDGLSDKMHDTDAFFQATDIASLVLAGANGEYPLADITEGSTHYHTVDVYPNWRHDRGMMKISRIGEHLFYRWQIL